MRADIHDGREQDSSNQRPDTLMQDRFRQIDEISCNARPDHTFGSDSDLSRCLRHDRLTLGSGHDGVDS